MNMHTTEHVPAEQVEVFEEFGGEAGQASWHDRFSIATKLQAVVLASTFVMAVLAGGTLGTMAYFGNAGETLRIMGVADGNTSKAALYMLQGNDDLAGFIEDGDRDALEASRTDIGKSLAMFEDLLSQNVERLDPQRLADVSRLEQSTQTISAQLASSDIDSEEASVLADEMRQLSREMTVFAEVINAEAIAAANPVFSGIRNSLIILLAVFVLFTVSSFFGSRMIVTNISGMIGKITGAMEEVSKGSSDTPIPGRERKDEIGAMARALAVFRAHSMKLRDLTQNRAKEIEAQLDQQKQLSEQMRVLRHEKSQLLENLADGFEVSVGELITAVSAASAQLKATSKQMVDLAEGSNDQANSAGAAMEKATANVTAAAAATDEFALSISEISRQASASASLARDATALVSSANTRMNDLSQAADEIGEIANLIQTIAQRTNLLALNASIEAARGGEAGRGFAVVASEVKELAMQTSNATSSVAEKIAAMQDSTRSSAGDLTSIVEQIGELEQAAVMIATAVDQQSVSGEELARNIDTVAEGSQQVSQRLRALRSASEETGVAAEDVVASADALGVHADDLREKAGRFIADVRRSARDLEADEAA